MKAFLFFSLVLLTGCASVDPIQVSRSSLTITRIESRMRYPLTVYYAIWVDSHGNEYSEIIRDTSAYKKGFSYAQLLKK